jgi:hypothetical protein
VLCPPFVLLSVTPTRKQLIARLSTQIGICSPCPSPRSGNRWLSSRPRRSTLMFDPSSTAFVPHWILSVACHFRAESAFLPRFQASHDSPAFWVGVRPGNLRAGSLAITAFPASFFATIPSYDFQPSIALPRSSRTCAKFTAKRERSDLLGSRHRLSPEPSPPNFRDQQWYWTFPSFAGLSDLVSQLGYAACSGVCLQALRKHTVGLRTACQLCTSATSRYAGDFHSLVGALPSAQKAREPIGSPGAPV